jgi:hypothetical protein
MGHKQERWDRKTEKERKTVECCVRGNRSIHPSQRLATNERRIVTPHGHTRRSSTKQLVANSMAPWVVMATKFRFVWKEEHHVQSAGRYSYYETDISDAAVTVLLCHVTTYCRRGVFSVAREGSLLLLRVLFSYGPFVKPWPPFQFLDPIHSYLEEKVAAPV